MRPSEQVMFVKKLECRAKVNTRASHSRLKLANKLLDRSGVDDLMGRRVHVFHTSKSGLAKTLLQQLIKSLTPLLSLGLILRLPL